MPGRKSSLVRLNDLYNGADHTLRSVEFATLLALLAGKLAEEVFVDSAENVAGLRPVKCRLFSKISTTFPEATFVEFGAGVIFRQNTFQLPVLTLQSLHCIVNYHTDFSSQRRVNDFLPSRIGWHKEYAVADIFVGIFLKPLTLGYKFIIFGFETVIDVFEEHETEHHRFIFGGIKIALSIH